MKNNVILFVASILALTINTPTKVKSHYQNTLSQDIVINAISNEVHRAVNNYIYTTGTHEAIKLLWDVIPESNRSDILGCNIYKRTLPGEDLILLNNELITAENEHYTYLDTSPSDPDNPPYYEIEVVTDNESFTLTNITSYYLLNFKAFNERSILMYLELWNPDVEKDLQYFNIFIEGVLIGTFTFSEGNPIILSLDELVEYASADCYYFEPIYSSMGPGFDVCFFFIQYMTTFYEPFPAAGASWYYDYNNVDRVGYTQVTYSADTLLGGIKAAVLEKFQYFYDFSDHSYHEKFLGKEYLHANADKVFIYRHERFYTLFDFSANVGDQWLIPASRIGNLELECDSVSMATVISKGDTIVNDKSLRYIVLDSYMNKEGHWSIEGMIIEKIGPIESYLLPSPSYHCAVDIFEAQALRCYLDDGFGLYETGITPTCDYLVNLDELHISSELNIRPNPAGRMFEIRFELPLQTRITIDLFNMEGRLIKNLLKNELHPGAHSFTFDCSNISPGVYIIQLTSNAEVITKRLVIQ